MRSHNGLAFNHSGARDDLRRAAALRWLQDSGTDPGAPVHELLEFDAAKRLLGRLEMLNPGLAEVVDRAEVAARCAAELQVAESAQAPLELRTQCQQALAQALEELSLARHGLDGKDLVGLLHAYRSLADIAGVLDIGAA